MTKPQIDATVALQEIIKEASQMLEVGTYRESYAIELTRLEPLIAKRWRRDMIEEIEQGEESDPMPTPEEFQAELTRRVFTEMKLCINMQNASALVLVHSFFDAFLCDILRVTATASHRWWIERVKQRKLSLQDFTAGRADEVEDRLIEAALRDYGQESLLKRISALICVCKDRWTQDRPASEFMIVVWEDFSYDPQTLERIDRERQDIIHRKGMDRDLQDSIDESILFLYQALMNFMLLVSRCFYLPVDFGPARISRIAERRTQLIIDPTAAPGDRLQFEQDGERILPGGAPQDFDEYEV